MGDSSDSATTTSGSTHFTTRLHRQGREQRLAEQPLERLHKDTQAAKSRRVIDADRVQANWGCALGDSLLFKLTPQLRNVNGQRIGHDQADRKSLHAREWPEAMVHALAQRSRLTPKEKTLAQRKLLDQVKLRQPGRHPQEHYARELLPSDVEAVIHEAKRLRAAGHFSRKPERTVKAASEPNPQSDLGSAGSAGLAEGVWQEELKAGHRQFQRGHQARERSPDPLGEVAVLPGGA